jgi:hypothetical protein
MFAGKSLWALPLALIGLGASGVAQAQDAPTVYAQVHCMQSTSADYEAVETEIWQPMHQAVVDRGMKLGWAFYGVSYGDASECDYYTVNQYAGEEQLNADVDYEAIFAEVHPDKSWDDAWRQTYDTRRIVRSELWTMVDGVQGPDAPMIAVNLMWADDGDAYEAMESEVWKPVHQVLTDDGDRAGWAFWSLMSPGGTEVPYNYATVDALNHIGLAPIADAFAVAHPDVDSEAVMAESETVRSLVRSEIWTLLSGTSPQQ